MNTENKQGLIFRKVPLENPPPRLTDILNMPISINFCCDGAHDAVTMHDNPKDQSGYSIKIYSWLVHSSNRMSLQDSESHSTLSSTKAEIATMVLELSEVR